MAINPDNITTIRVDQLNSIGLTLESLFPHTNGTELTSSSIGDLATLVATTIESLNGIGFLPISVTDGQQLPELPENPVFFLAGEGTYLNVNGFPDLICTENLNAIMSVTDHWEIAVEIPVNPLTGSVQSVTGSAVDNTDPLNPVINLSSAVTSVNGLTGAVVLDGDNIDVTDPTTSTDGTLNTALANIYASGGTPDLQAVTDEGNITTNPITVQDTNIFNTEIINDGNIISLKDIATGNRLFEIGGAELQLLAYNGIDPTYVQQLIFNITGDLNQEYQLPNKPTGVYYLATTDDIPTLDATPTNGSTNGVESNGVFDAFALKADKATTRQILRSKNNGTFGSHTGNTAETVLFTIPIIGGEFEIGDWMDFMFQFERLVTGTAINVRFRAGTNGNTSDSLIALLTMASTTLDSAIKRERFEFNSGNILKGMNSSSSATINDIANIAAARTSTSLNPANNWYLTVTAALGNSADTISCTGYQIGKTKTF